MNDWTHKLFLKRADIFLTFMNALWPTAEPAVEGMTDILAKKGIGGGRVLDLCCGNGRMAVNFARKGFKVVGVDMSPAFLADARKKADECGVSDRVKFIKGDVGKLSTVLGKANPAFDAALLAWTAFGYKTKNEDLRIFQQARKRCRKGAVLFIENTMHSEFLSLKFTPRSYSEYGDIVLLDERKYDRTTSDMKNAWRFYGKKGTSLHLIDTIKYQIHVYSLSELSGLLKKAGWKVAETYGSMQHREPMGPATAMNVVAVAV